MTTGVRTFLFTDLEGSTRRWMRDEAAMAAALGRHDAILRRAVEGAEGRLVKHTGDGVMAVFHDPLRAVEAAVVAQHDLRADPDGGRLLRARMGMHAGPCTERDGDFFGPTLNRAARIMAAAHGGQMLVSGVVAALVGDAVPLLDLGPHRLRDLLEPEHLHQVVVDDAGAYPQVRGLDMFDHNLPPQRTRLIGRENDVRTVRDLLSSSRLVTLTGIGGVGKTRLALEVAARELDYRDGVAFVDLAPVTDPDLVPGVTAAAVGLPPADVGPDAAPLLRLFARRSMLVVLDNCEHLLDGCAALAEKLLDEAPATAILATSREPLGIDAERVWRVPSITDRATVVELFVDRATAVGAELALAEATEAAIADLCRQLDGIPLAIELAAARTSHLSVEDIADRLDQRFRLLTGGRRRAPERHQTLQAAIDWSHDLLSDTERLVLRRAAVFTGGFTLEALEYVVSSDSDEEVVDVLGSLVDRSLVVAQQGRYSLLETVRLYALDRLAETGEADETRERHAEWVQAWLGEPATAAVMTPPTPERRAERDNVLAALEWVAGSGDLAALGRLAMAAHDGLGDGVWVDDGWRLFGRADVEAALGGEDKAHYLVHGAAIANALGDFRKQVELAERARCDAEPEGRSWRYATLWLANAQAAILDPSSAVDLYEELLATIPADEPEELGLALGRSADPALMTGDLEEAARRLDEAERISGTADIDLGLPHLLLGRYDRVREAVKALRRHHDNRVFGYRSPLLAGLLAAVEGRSDDAVAELTVAARFVERFPVRLVDHDVLTGFAVLAHHEGEHRRAAELLASVAGWTRTPGTFAVYRHYRGLVRAHLDADTVAEIRSATAGASVARVLEQEIGCRSRHSR